MTFYAGERMLVTDAMTFSGSGNTTTFSTTNTAYTYTGLQVTFIVPHTGTVKITITGRTWSSSTTAHSYIAMGVFTAAGSVWSPQDNESFRIYGTNTIRGSVATILPGLPPGQAAQASLYLRSEVNTATANTLHTNIIVRAA